MHPVFPDNGGGQQQWAGAPGGAAVNGNGQWNNQFVPSSPAQPDYNVNVQMGGQLPFDPSAMPFDPTASPQQPQPQPDVSGQIGGQIGGANPNAMHHRGQSSAGGSGGSGAVGSSAWMNAPVSGASGSWGPPSNFLENPLGALVASQGQAMMNKHLGWFNINRLNGFKYYFAVNNSYVLQKIKILLLPCTHKDWKRQIEPNSPNSPNSPAAGGAPNGQIDMGIGANGQPIGPEPVYLPPRSDLNAPDLYIPSMAFFTFALLMGYVLGTIGKFTPEVLLAAASSTLVTLILEVIVFSVGFYMVDSGSPKTLDLIAWSGYKYVGLIVALLCGLLFGNWAFFIAKFALGAASGLFLMCTLHRALTPPVEASHGGVAPTSPKRNYFLVLIGGVQIALTFFLLRTVSLPASGGSLLFATITGNAAGLSAAGAAGGAAAGAGLASAGASVAADMAAAGTAMLGV